LSSGLTRAERSLLENVREYIAARSTPGLLKECASSEYIYGGPASRDFYKEFAAHGWLVPSWPKQYGGLELSEQLTYFIRHELSLAGLPFNFAAAHMAGPMILRHGTEQQKERFLLRIARAEIEFNVSYSEPGAGSDLLALQCKAVDRGDHYLVSGQKIFNTFAHVADYTWCAVRTDSTAKKHLGISLLLFPIDAPGVTVRPMWSMGGTRTNEVFLDDVHVPKSALIGEENKGVFYIMGQLEFERVFAYGHHQRLFEHLLHEVRTNPTLRCDVTLGREIAQRRVELEVCKKLYFRVPRMFAEDRMPTFESAMEKLFVTEFGQRLADTAMRAFGPYSQLTGDCELAPARGDVEIAYRCSIGETIFGGTSEIMRSVIAQKGLGLPRSKK
jgi:3-oxocholest-4-en-26-oyl-CoA dehydrogenase alpha subunit